MTSTVDHVNGSERPAPWPSLEPDYDPVALAKAEAIRTEAAAKADALRIEAEGKAKAAETLAREEADKLRIQNQRAEMKLQTDQAANAERLAKLEASRAAAEAEAAKSRRAEAEAAEEAEAQQREEQRSEAVWKWGARAIYGIGLALALPLQLMAFYSDEKPFMISAPLLLEGLALVLAFGAAWAVAHRRDVAPYRVGIMTAAAIAAGINLWHGAHDPEIGLDAGIVGAIASLGGPIVLMAYEHGIAQKRDGIPSWRERRDEEKRRKSERAEASRLAAEKAAADKAKADEKKAAEDAAEAEQRRRDADRQKAHPEVWAVAESMRSARGLPFVADAIWSEAWYRVTGSKVVGITPEIESQSKAAQARMKSASEMPILGDFTQVESQKVPSGDGTDRRRFNGGTPPRRVAGDSQPHSPIARKQAALEQPARKASDEAHREGENA